MAEAVGQLFLIHLKKNEFEQGQQITKDKTKCKREITGF